MAEAARRRWQQWRLERGRSPPPPPREPGEKRPRKPYSAEARQKMSEAAKRRVWGLDVRYRMSCSHTGQKRSQEVRAKMAASQKLRRARERAERGGAGARARAAHPGGGGAQLSKELAREAAVIEMARLRQLVYGWMAEFEAQHGRKPSLPETAETYPRMYAAFVRYVGLREMLRAGAPAPAQAQSQAQAGGTGPGAVSRPGRP